MCPRLNLFKDNFAFCVRCLVARLGMTRLRDGVSRRLVNRRWMLGSRETRLSPRSCSASGPAPMSPTSGPSGPTTALCTQMVLYDQTPKDKRLRVWDRSAQQSVGTHGQHGGMPARARAPALIRPAPLILFKAPGSAPPKNNPRFTWYKGIYRLSRPRKDLYFRVFIWPYRHFAFFVHPVILQGCTYRISMPRRRLGNLAI